MSNHTSIIPGDRTVLWTNQCLPEWQLKPLKYLTRINARVLSENTPTDFEINYIDISSVDSNGRQNYTETMTFGNSPSRARRVVASGDVIVSTVRTYLKAISYIDQANGNLICSTGFAVLTPGPHIHPKFLFYWVRSEWFVSEIMARSVGVSYPAINAVEIGNLPFPMIELERQRAIADFLNQETARIDTLIEKKQKLMELLLEKRAALITRAVTRGLNPDVPMKDSGMEWLGEMPAYWKVRRLKHIILSIKFSNVDKHSIEDETPVRLCNYLNVYSIDEILPSHEFMEATATPGEIVNFTLREGDVIVTKDSEDWKDIAIPSYVSADLPDVLCGYHLALIRPKSAIIDGRYLFRSFCARSINHQFTIAATGITRYGLGKYWLNNSLFLVPPLDEQQAIAEFLDQETSKVDALIAKINKAIEKLHEYRTALITAVVTGKIDVRTMAQRETS